jgi:hypothetical protein
MERKQNAMQESRMKVRNLDDYQVSDYRRTYDAINDLRSYRRDEKEKQSDTQIKPPKFTFNLGESDLFYSKTYKIPTMRRCQKAKEIRETQETEKRERSQEQLVHWDKYREE